MFDSYYEIESMALAHGNNLRSDRGLYMKKRNRIDPLHQILLVNMIVFSGCAITPLAQSLCDLSMIEDGSYQGFFEGGLNSARVEVSVQAHQISSISILEHDALLGQKAEEPLVAEILDAQTTKVDVVSGATNSSHVIINAVNSALDEGARMSR